MKSGAMLLEKTLKLLKDLGLTEYETRVYTALVSGGPSTAGSLSEAANVPYSRIYDILSRLERRGWVEIQSGRPTRYKAKSPAEVIRLLRIERERRLKETGEEIVKELEPLYEQRAEARRPDIWIIRGERNLGNKVGEMLARAQVEVLVSLPVLPKEFLEPDTISPLLAAKKLALRMITSEKGKHINKLKAIPNLQVRFRKPLFGGGVIVDGKEVLLILASVGEKLGIWSNEVGLANFAKEYFEYLWKDSVEK
jgi:sugar-specific transcriptional regulator TrmB